MKKREFHGYGNTKNPTYSKYQAMKGRCLNSNNKSYPDYGGRGIGVCTEWVDSFEAFLSDMGEAPLDGTIERLNSDGDYSALNCKWATRAEQNRNKSNNVVVELDGIRFPTLKAAAEHYGVPYGTVRVRIKTYAWDIEKALKTPVDVRKRAKSGR